jgi:hypothetical protein
MNHTKAPADTSRHFVTCVTALSFDFCRAVAQIENKRGMQLQTLMEASMPAYEICYLDDAGALTYKFSANCDDDQRAKVLAHAMKSPSARRLEVWSGEAMIYSRPSAILERQIQLAS